MRWAGPFGLGIVAALIAVSVYSGLNPGPKPLTPDDVNRSVASALASQTAPPPYSQIVYSVVAPAVVVIEAQGPGSSGTASDALGSGVIVDNAGDILTCLHVVNGATSIALDFADGSKSAGTIQAVDAANDIAVVRPDQPPAKITPAVLGNPRSLQIGSEVFAIGNPFGLSGSITAGVVSGLDRSFQMPNNGPKLTGLIQIDAAVNPGNSGGPLVNRQGQVVGIVDGLVNPTGSDFFIGIGLAVPINVAGGAAGLPPD